MFLIPKFDEKHPVKITLLFFYSIIISFVASFSLYIMLFEAHCVTRVSMTLSVNVHLTVVHVAPGSPEEDRVQSEAHSKTPDTTSISHSVLKQAHIVFGGRVMKQLRVYMILVLVLIV